MVQPVRLVLGISVLLSLTGLASRANADPLPSVCRTGLVLGVSDQDAQDVTAAVCTTAKKRSLPGLLRVSVVGTTGQLRLALAHQIDTTREERTAHAVAPNVAEAIRLAPTLIARLEDKPASASAPAPAPAPAPAKEEKPEPAEVKAEVKGNEPNPEIVVAAEPDKPREPDRAASSPSSKPSTLAAMIGAHGTTAFAGGEAGFGGGGSLGLDGRAAQGFVEYAVARGDVDHSSFGLGARLKIGKGAVQPVVGGGWSYVDWETHFSSNTTTARRQGKGIGAFGEGGVVYAIANHQLMAIGRVNLGLYREQVTHRTTDATGFTSQRVAYNGSSDSITSTFALLAGYAYVFR